MILTVKQIDEFNEVIDTVEFEGDRLDDLVADARKFVESRGWVDYFSVLDGDAE